MKAAVVKALPIPEAALDQHTIALGKTRSAKSSKLRVIVEHLLRQEKPVCIIDPKGDWWGLRSGFPVVIFGGKHADVPLNEHAGAQIAELVATGNRPALIDLSDLMMGERTRFFIRYAEGLFKHTTGTRYQVIDEVHNFAPKGKIFDPDAGKCLHWANRLASEGQGKGLILLAASQRPQKTHNDFLTSCETLIACRVIHKADRDAVKDWIDGNADAAIGKQVLAELAQMERADAWCWSPEIGFGPERITWPMFETYDSFKPQSDVDAGSLKGWAEVDLEEVKGRFAAVVAEHEANDPKKLHRRIRDLEAELEKKPAGRNGPSDDEIGDMVTAAATEATELARAEAKAHIDDLLERARAPIEELAAVFGAKVADVTETLVGQNQTWGISRVEVKAPPRDLVAAAIRNAGEAAWRGARDAGFIEPPPRKRATQAAADNDGELTGPMQRILDSLAWWEGIGVRPADHAQAAFIAGYSNADNSAFKNPRGALKERGLVTYPTAGMVELTDAGRELAQESDIPASKRALHTAILALLTGPEQSILRPLLAKYPDGIGNFELAPLAGYSDQNNSAYKNPRGHLKAIGLVNYPVPGCVRASEILFPRGLR